MSSHRDPSAQARQFGLGVGAVATAVAAWLLLRTEAVMGGSLLLVIGMLLMILGKVLPAVLVLPARLWLGLAEILAAASTTVILGALFFLIVTPTGFLKRRFGWDPLQRHRASSPSYWSPYSARQRDPRHYEQMF